MFIAMHFTTWCTTLKIFGFPIHHAICHLDVDRSWVALCATTMNSPQKATFCFSFDQQPFIPKDNKINTYPMTMHAWFGDSSGMILNCEALTQAVILGENDETFWTTFTSPHFPGKAQETASGGDHCDNMDLDAQLSLTCWWTLYEHDSVAVHLTGLSLANWGPSKTESVITDTVSVNASTLPTVQWWFWHLSAVTEHSSCVCSGECWKCIIMSPKFQKMSQSNDSHPPTMWSVSMPSNTLLQCQVGLASGQPQEQCTLQLLTPLHCPQCLPCTWHFFTICGVSQTFPATFWGNGRSVGLPIQLLHSSALSCQTSCMLWPQLFRALQWVQRTALQKTTKGNWSMCGLGGTNKFVSHFDHQTMPAHEENFLGWEWPNAQWSVHKTSSMHNARFHQGKTMELSEAAMGWVLITDGHS